MGIGAEVSRALASTPRVGKSMGAAIRKNPKKSMAIGAGAMMGLGMMRGRRGSGTGQRMPGSQRGIRNY